MSVERWNCTSYCLCKSRKGHFEKASDDGVWVLHADHAAEVAQLRGNLSLAEEGLANYQKELDAIKRTREQERDYADVCYENERLSTLLGMVAVHLEHPELGGLGEEQLLAISEWYETFRENRGGVPQPAPQTDST